MNLWLFCVLMLAFHVAGSPFPEPVNLDGQSQQHETDPDLVTFVFNNQRYPTKISLLEAKVAANTPLRVLVDDHLQNERGEILMPDTDHKYKYLKEAFAYINHDQMPSLEETSAGYGQYLCGVKKEFDYLGIGTLEELEVLDFCVNALTFHETKMRRVNAEAQKVFDAIKEKVRILFADPVTWPATVLYKIGLFPHASHQKCIDVGGSLQVQSIEMVIVDTETFNKDLETLLEAINEKLKKIKFAFLRFEMITDVNANCVKPNDPYRNHGSFTLTTAYFRITRLRH